MVDLRLWLTTTRNTIDSFASVTPTSIDDDIVKVLDGLLAQSALIDWMQELINSWTDFGATAVPDATISALSAQEDFPTEEFRKLSKATGIDYERLINFFLPLLLRWLEKWLNNQGE